MSERHTCADLARGVERRPRDVQFEYLSGSVRAVGERVVVSASVDLDLFTTEVCGGCWIDTVLVDAVMVPLLDRGAWLSQ